MTKEIVSFYKVSLRLEGVAPRTAFVRDVRASDPMAAFSTALKLTEIPVEAINQIEYVTIDRLSLEIYSED